MKFDRKRKVFSFTVLFLLIAALIASVVIGVLITMGKLHPMLGVIVLAAGIILYTIVVFFDNNGRFERR